MRVKGRRVRRVSREPLLDVSQYLSASLPVRIPLCSILIVSFLLTKSLRVLLFVSFLFLGRGKSERSPVFWGFMAIDSFSFVLATRSVHPMPSYRCNLFLKGSSFHLDSCKYFNCTCSYTNVNLPIASSQTQLSLDQ